MPNTTRAGVTALGLWGASTGVTAGGTVPLSREMEYTQILCVENEVSCLLGFPWWWWWGVWYERLWFLVYEMEVLEPVPTRYSLVG